MKLEKVRAEDIGKYTMAQIFDAIMEYEPGRDEVVLKKLKKSDLVRTALVVIRKIRDREAWKLETGKR